MNFVIVFKAEGKVSDTGSAHWASSYISSENYQC
jgi:hypothetical protein